MQTGGVREHPFYSQTAFFVGGFPHSLIVAHAATGPPFSPWMRKGGEKNHMGRHLDTPSEIILQASLRMHFDGGQGSFLTRGSGIEKQPVPSRHYFRIGNGPFPII